MSEHAHRAGHAADATDDTRATEETRHHMSTPATMWVGWIWFAGITMIITGVFNVIEGLVALFKSEFYVLGPEGVLVFDLTTWGWVHLVIGVLVAMAGVALFSGALWARVAAVLLAAVNAISQLAFLSAYPVWSTIVIALCIVVIWAVVVHGAETTTRDWP